ncbi:hypothetical protein AB870_01540 [Pandoraea faecigallinarum]|uniref:DUF4148 domain-containing protein n=1 Tax=Pandoraea faecigallinarum TaxID=656179 RepID=A0A0H3WMG3_9BURK|nr:hypothetical protein [Pandoraea faecigallinarum]AKM29089.1 hypothetical protein AB870_01540 [Pandoraea faecigallinarum]
MSHIKFFAACLCLAGTLVCAQAGAQSYLGAGDLGSIRESNRTPAVSPAVAALGGRTATVTDAHSASASINRTASERNGVPTGPSVQEALAQRRALDTRDLQHPRQTKTFDSIARPSRPE